MHGQTECTMHMLKVDGLQSLRLALHMIKNAVGLLYNFLRATWDLQQKTSTDVCMTNIAYVYPKASPAHELSSNMN